MRMNIRISKPVMIAEVLLLCLSLLGGSLALAQSSESEWYEASGKMSEGHPVTIPLDKDNGYELNPGEIVEVVISSSPNIDACIKDPSGAVVKDFGRIGQANSQYTIETRGIHYLVIYKCRSLLYCDYSLRYRIKPPNQPPTPVPAPTPTPTPSPPAPSPTSLSISDKSGNIGATLMTGGAGFKPNTTITIKYDDKAVATATSDISGIFVATFKIPASKHGDHVITASDGTSTQELSFTVESIAPKTPQPLLPEMGTKVKSPIFFDWKDVTDESSPVIYNLQIATDKDFTAESILYNRLMAESEHILILTEEEELKLSSRETPYYWRIRATDAAQNESEWTGAGLFYVAEPFNFPIWVIYTIITIVALSLIIYFFSSHLHRRRLLLEGKKAELINMIDEALKEKKE